MYCHKKGREEEAFWKIKSDDKSRLKQETYFIEEIVYDELLFGDDARAWKNKTTNNNLKEIFVSDSGSTLHMVRSLENITNL